MNDPLPIEDCYKLLLKQTLQVNDMHSALRVNTNFLAGNFSKNHPQTKKNIEELKTYLNTKSISEIEGVYKVNNENIGLYYEANGKDLIGIVLKSDQVDWNVGDIRFKLFHTNGNKYNMYYYEIDTKTPQFVKSLSLENGRVWSYKKVGNENNYEIQQEKIDVASFKQIDSNTQYLYFKTFGNSKKKALKAFFEDTKDKLTADNVIVDLRNNSGGNSKYSDPFIKILKNKNVYIITNSFTGSNGEQFTLKLLKNKKAKHLGQTTRGVIAYGMNYGYMYNTPSGHFKMTPTDMNFHKYIAYEGKGISPEIPLDFGKDWITQTLDLIGSAQQ